MPPAELIGGFIRNELMIAMGDMAKLKRHLDTVTSGREVDEPAHDGHAAWPPPGLDCIISPITDFQLNWARFKVSGS